MEGKGLEKIKVWYIEASTGCTCCRDQNFYQGFFRTKEEAEGIAKKWGTKGNNPLGSQYARYGIYKVHETEAEILPDERIIALDRVYQKDHFNKRFYGD
jgi:Ni,Fe-hydrogenase I small subunit